MCHVIGFKHTCYIEEGKKTSVYWEVEYSAKTKKLPMVICLLCKLINVLFSAVTNGKHQWVPKEIAEAAEKYAKVSWGKHV